MLNYMKNTTLKRQVFLFIIYLIKITSFIENGYVPGVSPHSKVDERLKEKNKYYL